MIQQATSAQPLWVADISLWEIAMLYTLDRITLDCPLQAWVEAATAPSLVQGVGISPAMVVAVTVLTR